MSLVAAALLCLVAAMYLADALAALVVTFSDCLAVFCSAASDSTGVWKGVGSNEWVFGKRVGFAHSLTEWAQGVGFSS